jgi:hypothetical protein
MWGKVAMFVAKDRFGVAGGCGASRLRRGNTQDLSRTAALSGLGARTFKLA